VHAIRMDITTVVVAAAVMTAPPLILADVPTLTLVDVPTLMPVDVPTLMPVDVPTLMPVDVPPVIVKKIQLVKMMTN